MGSPPVVSECVPEVVSPANKLDPAGFHFCKLASVSGFSRWTAAQVGQRSEAAI